MCAIVGNVAHQGFGCSADRMARLAHQLKHRGPDASGIKRLSSATFGHCLLSILGLNSIDASQPALSGSAMLSFNGEIYNFKELSRDLDKEQIYADPASDTAVLFAALQNWGIEKTLYRLDGMFAFAFFDDETKLLHLARDPVGEKPLYWTKTKQGIWFSSEIKALLEVEGVSSAPNLDGLTDYLFTTKVNGSQTMFRQINELEPGTRMEFSARDGKVDLIKYWEIESGLSGSRIPFSTGLVDQFDSRLTSAIESRLLSDVPIGVLLSGGIDSNTLLERILEIDPVTHKRLFFADNSNPSISEANDVEVFLKYLLQRIPSAKLTLDRGLVGREDYFSLLQDLTWYYDEPVQFQNSPLLWGLTKKARKENIKVLLSGEGMDELLFGYDRFVRTSSKLRGISSKESIVREVYFGDAKKTENQILGLVGGRPDSIESTAPWQWLWDHVGQSSLDQLQLVFSQKYRLQILLQRQDRVGMASSVEVRVPFLAPSFLSWVNNLAMDAKFDPRAGTTKRILRELMISRLPDRILTKPKDGFPADMAIWLSEAKITARIRQYIADPNGFCQGFLNGHKALEIVDNHSRGAQKVSMLIWQLLALEMWHRSFST